METVPANYRNILTLADFDLLAMLISDYEVQSREIESKGGHAGYSRSVEKRLRVLRDKLLTGIPS